jgi:hypothetical protein
MDRLRSRYREVSHVQIGPMMKPAALRSVHGVDTLRLSFDRLDIDLLSEVVIASRWLGVNLRLAWENS